MNRKLVGCLASIALGTGLVTATPAVAFHGGGFGGGMHGGSFGGTHIGSFGGTHIGGFGGVHTGTFGSTHSGNFGSFATTHNGSFGEFGGAHNDSFAGLHSRNLDRHSRNFADGAHLLRHHRHIRDFALLNPLFYDYGAYYDGCDHEAWTPYGWRWSNVCYDYNY
jgi:hypothetical protein